MGEVPNNRNIGAVLLELGRITEQDIERALEHQRLQGGYFGQALVDLGVVEQEELEFGLAAQANLPYITPEPDQIDPEVAGLVPPAWADRHNAIPVANEDGWLTLVVDSPLKAGLGDELARRTGQSVKLALCAGRIVRDAIRKVYKLDPAHPQADRLLSLEGFWTLASSPSAPRWGLAVRRDQVTGWIDRGDRIERHALVHNWLGFLDQLLSPPPSQLLPGHGIRRWRASVRPDQSPEAVTVHSLSGPGGHDLLFVPARDRSEELVALPDASVLSALRDSLSSGSVTIAISSPEGRAARSLATRLPRLLLWAGHHTVCLFRDGAHAINEDVLVITQPEEGGDEAVLKMLAELELDAVGLEISLSSTEQMSQALGLAPLTFLVLVGHKDEPPPGAAWLLSASDDDDPDWQLIAAENAE